MQDGEPTLEALQREKLVLEIEKLRQDIARSNDAFRLELNRTIITAVTAGAAASVALLALATFVLNWLKNG